MRALRARDRRRGLASTVALAIILLLPPAGAGAQPGPMGFDHDPQSVHRIDEADPVRAAIAVSTLRFADGTGGFVVLSRSDGFADSLSASALTADAPMLLTPGDTLAPAVRAEIERVLRPPLTVFLLGGTSALSQGIEDELADAGYTTRRLAGATRVETAIAVAQEVLNRRPPPSGRPPVLLARAFGTGLDPTSDWADSVTGGAYGAYADIPVLLTPTEALHPAVAEALTALDPPETILLGGEAALSAAVEQAVPNPRRIAGPNRAATAVAIAEALWGDYAQDRYVLVNVTRTDGWAFGLPIAGGAAIAGAPLLAVGTDVLPPETANRVDPCDDLLVVGDTSVISEAAIIPLDRAQADDCPRPPTPPPPPAAEPAPGD